MTIFAICGAIAIVISFLLLIEDKKKGYGLQKSNIAPQSQKGEG